VIGKIKGDLDDAGVDISEHRLRKRLDEAFQEAKQQIMQE